MVRTRIYQLFYWIFAVLFSILFIKILFFDTIHNYNTGNLLGYLLFGILIIGLCAFLIFRFSSGIQKHFSAILTIFLLFYGLLILRNGFALRFTPSFDFDAIYGGAVQWLEEGSFPNYYEYFGYFPNNLGGMFILHIFFLIASEFGITDYFAVGIVVNTLFILLTVCVTSRICQKLGGAVAGVLALCFFAVSLPFLFMGAAFYTDSLSMLFPVLFYYCYLLFKEQTSLKKQVLYAILMAGVLAVGLLIKFTVLIALIAVVIDALLCLSFKKVCLFTAVSILLAALAVNGFHTYIEHNHITDKATQQLATPYLHWVMMGLQGNGSYTPEDYEYTRSFAPEDQNEACLTLIRQRVSDLGVTGLSQLYLNKAAVCFGDGTYALSDFLDDAPVNETSLHNYILYGGSQFELYQTLTTGMLLMEYLCMIAGSFGCIFYKKSKMPLHALAPRLAGLGILAFLLLWETSGRYFTNFVPMLLICAVLPVAHFATRRRC